MHTVHAHVLPVGALPIIWFIVIWIHAWEKAISVRMIDLYSIHIPPMGASDPGQKKVPDFSPCVLAVFHTYVHMYVLCHVNVNTTYGQLFQDS